MAQKQRFKKLDERAYLIEPRVEYYLKLSVYDWCQLRNTVSRLIDALDIYSILAGISIGIFTSAFVAIFTVDKCYQTSSIVIACISLFLFCAASYCSFLKCQVARRSKEDLISKMNSLEHKAHLTEEVKMPYLNPEPIAKNWVDRFKRQLSL